MITPREFIESRGIVALSAPQSGVLYLCKTDPDPSTDYLRLFQARTAPNADSGDLVLAITSQDWDSYVPEDIRGVWAPSAPIVDAGEFLAVSSMSGSGYGFGSLYAAAEQVFLSLPPIETFVGSLGEQVAAMEAWIAEKWSSGPPFEGPEWTLTRNGSWVIESESSGRRFHVGPRTFRIEFGASLVAAMEVLERVQDSHPEVMAGVTTLDMLGEVRSQWQWRGSIEQLIAVLTRAIRTRDWLRSGEQFKVTVEDDLDGGEESVVIVPEFDLEEYGHGPAWPGRARHGAARRGGAG